MHPKEAAELIEAMIDALKENPSQFHLSIKFVGQQVTSHGGTGISISANGGGPGSTTIGNQVSMSDSSITIAQQRGSQAIDEQIKALLETLVQISTSLRTPAPDKALIQRLVASLKNSWVPGVIIGVVANAVSKAIGI